LDFHPTWGRRGRNCFMSPRPHPAGLPP
jgi:hypothetical protein